MMLLLLLLYFIKYNYVVLNKIRVKKKKRRVEKKDGPRPKEWDSSSSLKNCK